MECLGCRLVVRFQVVVACRLLTVVAVAVCCSYIKKYMGAPTGVDIDALKAENDRLKAENKQLTSTLEELNQRVLEDEG